MVKNNNNEAENDSLLYAFVFVNVSKTRAFGALDELQQLPGVGLATTLAGGFDVALLVKTDSATALGNFVVDEVRQVNGVVSTLTNVIISAFVPLVWPLHTSQDNDDQLIDAIVLVKTEGDRALRVRNEIKRFDEVGLVAAVTGEYDLILWVRAESIKEMGNFVVETIRGIEGVADTVSYIVYSDFSPKKWPLSEK